MLFPQLANAPHGHIQLDEEARQWMADHPADGRAAAVSPFLDPAYCLDILTIWHRQRGWEWSYGGYLEDRRHLWAGSYLDRSRNYLHLGLDLNVPAGTLVAADWPGQVMLIDDDRDEHGGWGMRIILRLQPPEPSGLIMILAHIRNARCRPGQAIGPGDILAEVGVPPTNGNWYPHLHVQLMREKDFLAVLETRFAELDGYGHPDQMESLRALFPDPTPWLGLAAPRPGAGQ